MKVQDEESYLPLELGSSDSIAVSKNVIAIGYPFADLFEYYLKDFSSTITRGYISSVRKSTSLIQHTASLNPGSSGGPLFNEKGEVIGINNAKISEANEMFFSIAVHTLKNWLDKTGYRNLLIENKEQALKIIESNSMLTKAIKTGQKLFIHTEQPAKVYLDGRFTGMVPGYVEDLKSGEHILEIENDFEEFIHKINVDKNRRMVFNLYPIMEKGNSILFINSNPEGAAFYLDGQLVSATPYQVYELAAGDHEIKLVSDNFMDYRDDIVIKRNEQQELFINLTPACELSFSPALIENTKILISRKAEEFSFQTGEKILQKNFNLDEKFAYIIGRFLIEGTGKFQFRIVDKFTDSTRRLHFQKDDHLYVVRTNPGLYQIRGINCNIGTVDYRPTLSTISLWEDFELKAGEVIYIGSYTINSRKVHKGKIIVEVKDDLPQIIEEFHSLYHGTDFMFVRSLFLE